MYIKKYDFKKKKQPNVLPTIRFEIKLEKPSSEQFSELNYNKLVVKALKIVKKRSKKSSHTTTIEQTDATTTTTKKKTITIDCSFALMDVWKCIRMLK